MPINHDASFVDTLPRNVAVQFLERVEKSAANEAFRYPDGDSWTSVTWKEVGDEVSRLAAGLMALGIEPEQRVGISSGTRYEWILADLAIMCAGAATTTVYPSTNAEDTTYILSDSESHVVFAEDDEQIKKLLDNKAELPHVQKVVTFDGTVDGDWVIGLSDLAELGDAYLADKPDAVVEHAAAIAPDQLATLIYTSGTTGRPKGVRLRHRSWVYEGEAIARAEHPRRDRPRVPLAADGALLRQGADVDPDGVRLRRRHRRPGRQDHRQPRRREADVHGRGAAHLREGARPDRHHAGRRGRRQGEDLQEGLRGRPQGRPAQARGQVGPAAAQAAARRLRQAGVLQDPRPLRWTRPVLHLRCGRAQPRDRRVVPRRGHRRSSRATASPRPRPARS